MDRESERWRHGVVVVRIGINDLGVEERLEEMARDPDAAAVVQTTRACTADIAAAVALVRERHPETYLVLVGILDNADCPPWSERPRSPRELANVTTALDRFDAALRRLAEADPRIAFFDDRDWFRAHWGSRDPDGTPAYRTIAVGRSLRVVHAMGDAPTHSILADRHAGLVWNTLWCQSLVRLLATQHGLPVREIAPAEVEQFLVSQTAGRS
jgi:hypothetical protein